MFMGTLKAKTVCSLQTWPFSRHARLSLIHKVCAPEDLHYPAVLQGGVKSRSAAGTWAVHLTFVSSWEIQLGYSVSIWPNIQNGS